MPSLDMTNVQFQTGQMSVLHAMESVGLTCSSFRCSLHLFGVFRWLDYDSLKFDEDPKVVKQQISAKVEICIQVERTGLQ